jgi:hypothetical protein
VWQFKFVCCPQVLEISSVTHHTSCFGVGFSLCWDLVSLPHSLSLGQFLCSVSQPPAVSLLWWFAGCFSIFQCHLTLDVAHCLRRWALWTASCPLSAAAYHQPAVAPSVSPAFVYWKFMWRSVPFSSAILWCTYSIPPSLLCASFQFLVYCSVFFCWAGGHSA